MTQPAAPGTVPEVFATAFSSTPKMFVGTRRLETNTASRTTVNWKYQLTAVTTTGFQINYSVGAGSETYELKIYTAAIDTSYSHIYAAHSIDFAGSCNFPC